MSLSKTDMQLNVLDGMADAWAEEVNIAEMAKNVTSPMDLNRNAPDDVRQQFRKRMVEQIDALMRQAFVEGAHRAVCMVQDAYKQAGWQKPEQH